MTLVAFQGCQIPLYSKPNVIGLTLDHARSIMTTVHFSYIQRLPPHEWEIVGDNGWLVLDVDKGALRLGLRETEAETLEPFSTDPDGPYRMEHQAFLDHLDGLRLAESPADAGARAVELYAMAMRSWKENRGVDCAWRRFQRCTPGEPKGAGDPIPAQLNQERIRD